MLVFHNKLTANIPSFQLQSVVDFSKTFTAIFFKLPSRKFPSFDKKPQESSFGEQFTYKIHSLIPLKSLNFKQHNDKSLDMQRSEL